MSRMVRVAFFLVLSLLLIAAAATGEPAVKVSGTVVGEDDKPVAGAEVFVSEGPPIGARVGPLSPGDVLFRPEVIARTRAAADGAFSLELPDDACESYWARTWLVLWVHHPGSALSTVLVGHDWPVNAAPVKVRLADTPALAIEVVAPDGAPLPRVRVLPEQVDDVRLPHELAQRLGCVSDDAGRVVLRGVTPTSLDLVRIETDGYGVQWSSLPAASVDGARRIVLLPVGTIHGRLTADDPRALAAVPVRLATWLTAGDEAAGGGLAEAITDADGRFEVPAIAAGALSVRPQVHADLPFRCQPVAGRPLEEATTTELTIKLERAVRVEGVVRDRDSGEPLAGAAVWFDYQSPRDLPRSDEQGRYGRFLLPGRTSPSPWRMPRHYYFPQYTLDTQPVPAAANQVELKPLLLARGATLRGRVVNADGKDVAGAEIEAHWELASGGENVAHAWSDREGGFTLDGIEPKAQVRLSAWSAHGATADDLIVPPGSKEPVTLVVARSNALAIEARVLDADERPIAGAVVRICRQRRDAADPEDDGYVCFEGRQRFLTDAAGRFRTPAVLARGSEYRAEVTAPGMLPATTDFTAETTSFGNIVLHELPRLRAIDGLVVDRGGKPVAGLHVFQTGDGPRRTQTTTDEHGHFRLSGVYSGPAFLLVRGRGYRLQGFLVDGGDTPAELTVRADDEPVERRLKTLAEPLSVGRRREIALRLIEPMLPALKQGELEAEKVWLLDTLAALDPNRVAEFAGLPIFNQAGLDLGDEASYQAALTLVGEDEAEALAIGEAIGAPHHRGRLYLAVSDRLPDDERERKAELLSTAMLHARAEPEVAQRVDLMGQIAERWLDLGEIERGTALLRQGQKLAEELPAPSEAAERAHELAPHLRAYFAGSLARIDGPAAIKLSRGFTDRFADRYRIVVARGLAAHDAAAAERVLAELDFSTALYWQALGVLHRMAGIDPERAARLARKCAADSERGYALGIVAHGVARHNAARAAALLDEAYDLLERASAEGVGISDASKHPAILAAALLPVAERIDPALVERYFWRAMALRPPRPARLPAQRRNALVPGALAIFISRYDREAARVLAEPIAAQVQTLAADADNWTSKLTWYSLAVIDARWATSLIETLPESPPLALRAAKNVARRNLANALSPSAYGWWHRLYKDALYLPDPDARDDER